MKKQITVNTESGKKVAIVNDGTTTYAIIDGKQIDRLSENMISVAGHKYVICSNGKPAIALDMESSWQYKSFVASLRTVESSICPKCGTYCYGDCEAANQ